MTPRHTTPAPVAHGGGGGRLPGAGTHTPSRRERVVDMIRNISVDGEEALAVDTAEELGRALLTGRYVVASDTGSRTLKTPTHKTSWTGRTGAMTRGALRGVADGVGPKDHRGAETRVESRRRPRSVCRQAQRTDRAGRGAVAEAVEARRAPTPRKRRQQEPAQVVKTGRVSGITRRASIGSTPVATCLRPCSAWARASANPTSGYRPSPISRRLPCEAYRKENGRDRRPSHCELIRFRTSMSLAPIRENGDQRVSSSRPILEDLIDATGTDVSAPPIRYRGEWPRCPPPSALLHVARPSCVRMVEERTRAFPTGSPRALPDNSGPDS